MWVNLAFSVNFLLVDAKPDGKELTVFLAEKRDAAFRDFLRTMADHDPSRAAKLSRYFETIKRDENI
jgi:hypothetical protein